MTGQVFNRIEALNFRCLRHIDQPLHRFHILIGPNASGKSTFLDVIRFLGDLIQPSGVETAIQSRTQNWHDLVWMQESNSFEVAVEMRIPEEKRTTLKDPSWNICRYQVRVGQEHPDERVGLLAETFLLKRVEQRARTQQLPLPSFPSTIESPPGTICESIGRSGTKTVINKVPGSNDYFYGETQGDTLMQQTFALGPQRSALGNLPEDETQFPVATWFKQALMDGIEFLYLDSEAMRRPSPPGKGVTFRSDGSNLPWVVRNLKQDHLQQFELWVDHLRTSFPDIETVDTYVRPEDRHCYLRVKYRTGLIVPSWGLSDGTLRLFALTLLPYLPDLRGTFLIEEPENGIHPRAVETVYESLSSVYNSQVLVATHSPVFLSIAELDEILCFAQNDNGASNIVLGPAHPKLKNWQHETDLGTLFASGILG
jgi:predicted ATPase